MKIAAYGDCNTLGFRFCEKKSWPEMVGEAVGAEVTNLGHTMSTTREMLAYAKDYPPTGYDTVFVQYGLVDSWLTFRHSPYVLYYPTNPFRKLLRKLVKKIKKYARTLRLHDLLGWQNVVPLDEYVRNIEALVTSAPETHFILVSTAPNLDLPRNPRIIEYNKALADISARYPNTTYVDVYSAVHAHMDSAFFEDGTHLNPEGLALVAKLVTTELLAARPAKQQ